MSEQSVHCKKLDKELPALEQPPFDGELGARPHGYSRVVGENQSDESVTIGSDEICPLDFHACADRNRFTVANDDGAAFNGLDDTDESIRGRGGNGSDQYQHETNQVDNREPHRDLPLHKRIETA